MARYTTHQVREVKWFSNCKERERERDEEIHESYYTSFVVYAKQRQRYTCTDFARCIPMRQLYPSLNISFGSNCQRFTLFAQLRRDVYRGEFNRAGKSLWSLKLAIASHRETVWQAETLWRINTGRIKETRATSIGQRAFLKLDRSFNQVTCDNANERFSLFNLAYRALAWLFSNALTSFLFIIAILECVFLLLKMLLQVSAMRWKFFYAAQRDTN